MGAAYNLGYLTGYRSKVHLVRNILRCLPPCPYPPHTAASRAWYNGILDSISDRAVLV